MEKEILTPEQNEFINKATIAGLLGPLYAIATGMYKQFWLCFVPFYNIYLIFKLVIKGRRMAWEKTDKNYDAFCAQQKKLSKIAKILLGITAGIFIIQVAVLLGSISFFTGDGSFFGKDVASDFSQRIFTNKPISDITSPSFSLKQAYVDFQKDTRGAYEGVSFKSFSRENNKSTLKGNIKFTNTSIPVCVHLLKFGENWKVADFSESCETNSDPSGPR